MLGKWRLKRTVLVFSATFVLLTVLNVFEYSSEEFETMSHNGTLNMEEFPGYSSLLDMRPHDFEEDVDVYRDRVGGWRHVLYPVG